MISLNQTQKTQGFFHDLSSKTFGATIAQIMTETGYPDDIMAEMLYISESELEQIKAGVLIPTKEQAKEILEHLGFAHPWSTTLHTMKM